MRAILSVVAFFLFTFHTFAADRRPNLVLLLTDDQRADCLGVAGHPLLKTPNIDRLAKEGTHFPNAFVTTSICCVSRASFMTGRLCRNHGVGDFNTSLPADVLAASFPALLEEGRLPHCLFRQMGDRRTAAERRIRRLGRVGRSGGVLPQPRRQTRPQFGVPVASGDRLHQVVQSGPAVLPDRALQVAARRAGSLTHATPTCSRTTKSSHRRPRRTNISNDCRSSCGCRWAARGRSATSRRRRSTRST